jgi:hypothetical protein
VSHLASVEAKVHFHFVAFEQETTRVIQLNVEIVDVGTWANLNFFDRDDGLILTSFVFFLLQLVLVLTVIHDLARRGFRCWSDLDQIEAALFSELECFERRENAEHCSVFVDDANFGRANLAVDAKTAFAAATFGVAITIAIAAAAACASASAAAATTAR